MIKPVFFPSISDLLTTLKKRSSILLQQLWCWSLHTTFMCIRSFAHPPKVPTAALPQYNLTLSPEHNSWFHSLF